MNDPWSNSAPGEDIDAQSTFEDDFLTSPAADSATEGRGAKLPDSDEYLGRLGKPDNRVHMLLTTVLTLPTHPIRAETKLKRLQKSSGNTLEQIRNRRDHCIEALLASDEPLEQRERDLALDQPTAGSQQQILRLLNPHQPLTVGEVLHLVKHDQLADTEEDQPAEDGLVEDPATDDHSVSSSTSPPSR